MKANTEPVPPTSADINRQMLEIKKKIQLSEGQRKASFEDCEAERKANCDEIHKLKKEITELVKELRDKKKATAGLRVLSKKLEEIVGPCEEKGVEEIKELLDLQIIDKSKALNLVQYKTKKRQSYLAQLGKEYQTLISQKARKEIVEKVDKPTRKATCDLQNNIHAVEVQLLEANHISVRYRDIKKSLLKDAARFESNIKKIEEQLEEQNNEISGLQEIMNEATRKKGTARGHLLHEEKVAMSSANSRERQTAEGRRLVAKRRQELEMLEKKIFHVTKIQTRPPTGNNNDDTAIGTDEEMAETPTPPQDVLARTFEVLKHATGATANEEVSQKFSSQKETQEKLVVLRMKSEEEKKNLEKKLDELTSQLEYFKYAEVKESQRKSTKMDQIQNLIEEEHKKSEAAHSTKAMKEKTIKTILSAISELYLCINPLGVPGNNITSVLEQINNDLKNIILKSEEIVENLAEENTAPKEGPEEKWLPGPYSGLVRRTPIPQAGASPAPPPPPGSEDEEEVPSRTYLKRQAQIVVDAKLRRKNVRIPPKRN